MKIPDAIHAATALASGCDLLIANHKDLKHITTVNVIILSEIV